MNISLSDIKKNVEDEMIQRVTKSILDEVSKEYVLKHAAVEQRISTINDRLTATLGMINKLPSDEVLTKSYEIHESLEKKFNKLEQEYEYLNAKHYDLHDMLVELYSLVEDTYQDILKNQYLSDRKKLSWFTKAKEWLNKWNP